MNRHIFYSCLMLLLFFSISVEGQVKLSKLMSDNMVIQRDMKIDLWGKATKGTKVKVTFNGKTYKDKADRNHRWEITLPPMPAGGPYEMKIVGVLDNIVIKNIMVGDVWICSGQSNMEWPLSHAMNAAEEIKAANDANIRHFKVPRSNSEYPQEELTGGTWELTTPQTANDFTAVGYFFAKELRATNPDVPIGLINTTWGGSTVEAWMSNESLGIRNINQHLKELKKKAKETGKENITLLEEKIGEKLSEVDKGMSGDKALWASETLDDSKWNTMNLPGMWEKSGLKNLDGTVWFRTEIELTASQSKQDLEIHLGKIDDSDITYINGQKVGEMKDKWDTERIYKIPTRYLKAGKNILTVRVEDTGGNGGFYGEAKDLYWKSNDKQQSLAGAWKYKIGKAVVVGGVLRINHTPTVLYNQMVSPMIGYGIKGVIWYQGESNAYTDKAYEYRTTFANMIKDWRTRWGQGDFPFLYVQLANYMKAQEDPNTESNWAILRESQADVLKTTPNTGQAVIIDIGDANDIHPRNKQDVGYRLAAAAKKLAYNQDIVYSGPTYVSHSTIDNTIRVKFTNTGSGLAIKDKYGYIKGFTIAGEDGKYHWAMGKIEGDEIILWSNDVAVPKNIRYGWADNPDDANLYNKEGFPASPFRTK